MKKRKNRNKSMKNIGYRSLIIIPLVCMFCYGGCKKEIIKDEKKDSLSQENEKFLKVRKNSYALFKVLLMSDKYIVSQMRYKKYIRRVEDPSGDKYIMSELKKYDKINEVREGVVRIWLYPDNGRIMKIRPQRLTNILEIDQLISEDIQRWNFEFPKKVVEPTKFDIKYRVVLRKKLSDAEILKQMKKELREQY